MISVLSQLTVSGKLFNKYEKNSFLISLEYRAGLSASFVLPANSKNSLKLRGVMVIRKYLPARFRIASSSRLMLLDDDTKNLMFGLESYTIFSSPAHFLNLVISSKKTKF